MSLRGTSAAKPRPAAGKSRAADDLARARERAWRGHSRVATRPSIAPPLQERAGGQQRQGAGRRRIERAFARRRARAPAPRCGAARSRASAPHAAGIDPGDQLADEEADAAAPAARRDRAAPRARPAAATGRR